MKCPNCKAKNNFRTTDSRPRANHIYRRKECISCGHRVTTFERIYTERNIETSLKTILDKTLVDLEAITTSIKEDQKK